MYNKLKGLKKMKKILKALTCLLILCVAVLPCATAEGATKIAVPAIDLTQIINAVIALLGALITSRLIPWLKATTSEKQQAIAKAASRTAVYAAQQLYDSKMITDRLDYAEKWLLDNGFTVDRTMIEAAVKELKINSFLENVEMVSEPVRLEGAQQNG